MLLNRRFVSFACLHKVGLGLVFLSSIGFAQNLKLIDFRSSKSPLYVQMHKSSPPYAALQDARDNSVVLASSAEEVTSAVPLTAGRISLHNLAKLQPPENKEIVHVIALHGMVISRTHKRGLVSVHATGWPKAMRGMTVAQNTMAAGDKSTEEDVHTVAALPSMYAPSGKLLSLAQRKQLLLNYYGNVDLSAPAPSQKLKQLIAQQKSVPTNPSQKMLWSYDKSGARHFIYVAKPNSTPHRKSSGPSHSSNSSVAANRSIASTQSRAFTEAMDDSNFALVQNQNKAGDKNYALSGRIHFKDGLAYTGSGMSLHVYREVDSEPLEQGKVFLHDGKFQISVQVVRGYLIAELQDKRGKILGHGELDLNSLPAIPYSQTEVNGLKLALHPYINEAEARLISARSFGRHQIDVSRAQVRILDSGYELHQRADGLYHGDEVLPTSNYILRAEKKNHWGTLMVGDTRTAEEMKLFPNEMMSALIGLSTGTRGQAVRNYAVVWGRVTLDGQPVSGAKVELAGGAGVRPIYFNAYIPDSTLEATTTNGLFAFVLDSTGLEAVRAFYKGRYLPTEIIPTEFGHVAYVEINQSGTKTANVHVYDPLRQAPLSDVQLSVIGTNTTAVLKGQQMLQIPAGHGLMVVEADAGPAYDITRTTWNRQDHLFNVPMIPTQWLTALLTNSRVNLAPGTGRLVGLFPNLGHFTDVKIDGLDATAAIYFDARGNLIPATQANTSAQGFVIYNLTPGYHNLSLYDPSSGAFLNHGFIADVGVTNAIQF